MTVVVVGVRETSVRSGKTEDVGGENVLKSVPLASGPGLAIALRLVSTIQGLTLMSRGLPVWAGDEFGEAWRGSI